MSENPVQVLADKNVIPTEELIFSLIGHNSVFWERIINYASENYSDTSGSWNWYNDGKRWLYKFVRKKKTLFWAGIINDSFRITFYFGDKAEPLIASAILPPAVKDEFSKAKKYGAVRPITVLVREQSDADIVITLISIKDRIK